MVQARRTVIRVGFVFDVVDAGWLGGVNYRRNLLSALYECPDRRIAAVLLAGMRTPDTLLQGFPSVEVIRLRILDRGSLASLIRKLVYRSIGRDWLLERALRRKRIDVLSHSEPLGPRATIPCIGWIADFQYLRLPEFFTDDARRMHEAFTARVLDGCARIVLSSKAAQEDLCQVAPDALARSRILHFVSGPPQGMQLPDAATIASTYGVREPYVLLPNQFWAHKNHGVVLAALEVLVGRGSRALVLATGNPRDYRQPGHFATLMEEAKRRGVENDFRVLGVVPYPDLMGLMRDAAAVINPSFFEGWSTTVEEAKSMGKLVLLSDIPVHREQAPGRARYFNPRDPEDVADAIEEALRQFDAVQERDRYAGAQRMAPERRRAFARDYQDLLLEAVARR